VQFTWSNQIGDASIKGAIDKNSIQKQSLVWPWEALPQIEQDMLNDLLMPDKHGIFITFDDHPWLWGTIGDREDTFTDTSFPVNGTSTFFSGYKLVNSFNNWSATAVKWSQSGVSLGTIAKRMVQTVLEKPGANIPMTFDDDEITANIPGHDASYHERNFAPYDIANLTVSDLLKNISNVDGGPDIDFRPYVEDGRVMLHMYFGTEANPYIRQTSDIVFPISAHAAAVSGFKQTVSASYRADRVYATGSGQDEGTLTATAEDLSAVQAGYPLKEASVSSTSVTEQETLNETAEAALSPWPLAQWEITVRADYAPHPLGTYFPGDEAIFPIRGFPTIPDGDYKARIVAMSGNEGRDVTLKLSAGTALY
jgi:hypothetical protein